MLFVPGSSTRRAGHCDGNHNAVASNSQRCYFVGVTSAIARRYCYYMDSACKVQRYPGDHVVVAGENVRHIP